jgi:OOP family OmpA-OmpF porin
MRSKRRFIARWIATAIAGAATMFFAGAAAAQASAPERSANLYVGAAFGQAKAEKACAGLADCEQNDNAFGAFAGYWLQPNFAAEVGYHNLGRATAPGGTYVRSNVWEAVGVGAWRLRDPFSLYGKLGLFRGAQEGGGALSAPKELVTGITYGLRGEWQRYPRVGGGPVLPSGNIDVLRVAALWRFQ